MNTQTKVPPSVRRARFNAEVQKHMKETGCDYNAAFRLVAVDPDPNFACVRFANDRDLDADLSGASKRRDEIQTKVKALMRDLGLSYDGAFRKVLAENPQLQGHASAMMPQGGMIRFNFRDGESLTTSKTDYSEQQGFKVNPEPMPKPDLGQQGVVGDWARQNLRPYVAQRVKG